MTLLQAHRIRELVVEGEMHHPCPKRFLKSREGISFENLRRVSSGSLVLSQRDPSHVPELPASSSSFFKKAIIFRET